MFIWPLLPKSDQTGLSIGTGMLFHTGPRLYYGGPGALFLSYCLVATVVYAVLVS
jgi:amino acid permease